MALTPNEIKQLRDYYSELGVSTATIEKNLEEAAKNQKFLTQESKKAAEHLNEASLSADSLASSLQDSIQELSKGDSYTRSALKSFKSLQSVASQFKYDMADYSTMSKKEIERNITKIKQEKDNLELLLEKERITGEEAKEAQFVVAKSEELLKIAEKRLAEERRIQQQMGLTGAAVQGIVGALNKLGISSPYFDDLKENMRDAAKSGGVLKVMFTATKGLVKGIGQSLTDPLTVMTFLLNAGLKADKQTTELAKSLGIGKNQANQLRENFVKYSLATGDAFVTTDKLMEAQGELTQELGIAGQYSGKTAEDFSRLTKLMGLSASEAGKLARLSLINGTTIEATAKSIIKGSAASQRANKISIDQRTILKDVANLSAGILIKFQGNPEALGAAVVQAKALGLTLDEVDKIGESLLNWESSIENELKAELITGRQLNFEKARAAALTGDQATLMQEVANQAGSLTDFQNMNVIAQKSLAEAFGMSRDEMSKMLIEQEKVNKLGDVSKMTLDEQLKALKAQGEPLDSVLYKQIQQQSAQEKFNNAIEKLQDIIGNLVAGPLGQLIDAFASVASSATVIKLAVGALLGMSITRLVTGLAALVVPLVTGAAASTTMMSALTLGVGLVAILGSIYAISSAMNSAKEEMSQKPSQKFAKGGIVTSEINNATVGEAGPEAIIPLNSPKADKILGGGSIDLTPMINAINEVKAAINQLGSRPSVAYIQGKDAFSKDVVTTSVQNTYPFA